MPNHKAYICIVIFVLLVGLFPVGTYAAGSTWADFAPTRNLDITMPQSLHDFPIAPDAVFNPWFKATDGVHIMFSYTSTYSMDDLFNMYAQYMKNSKDFKADKGDGTGTLYYVVGLKSGYPIQIAIAPNSDSQVNVMISPKEE